MLRNFDATRIRDALSLQSIWPTNGCMATRIQQLYGLGQSVWCDNLSRVMIDSGELQRLIDLGVVGITSNPTIFMKAIGAGGVYDERLAELSSRGLTAIEIYEQLAIADIADAADILKPVYERTHGVDGFVSLEVNPHLAHDTAGTIAEAKRLWAALSRPNVFIKVPATAEGIPAIEALIAEGISVNVTLIFSLASYEQVMRAYIEGLKRRRAAGGELANVASVASFFVSRVDTMIDQILEQLRLQGTNVSGLSGKAANANAKLAYAKFERVFDSNGEFGALAAKGAKVQRPLWASTSTKNPAYQDTIYVDNLIGPNTVNTMPPQTLEATLDHGQVATTIRDGFQDAQRVLMRLADLDIDMSTVTSQLLRDGVKLFAESFDSLLENIRQKQATLSPASQRV